MSRKGELFDIITMDSKQLHSGKIPWIHKQKLIQACMGEGISFEVCYGEALQDNDLRRQVSCLLFKKVSILACFVVLNKLPCSLMKLSLTDGDRKVRCQARYFGSITKYLWSFRQNEPASRPTCVSKKVVLARVRTWDLVRARNSICFMWRTRDNHYTTKTYPSAGWSPYEPVMLQGKRVCYIHSLPRKILLVHRKRVHSL